MCHIYTGIFLFSRSVAALLFPLTGSNRRISEYFRHTCPKCGRTYKWRSSLKSHLQNECGKEPSCLCPHCPYRCKVRSNLLKHVRNYHKNESTAFINQSKSSWVLRVLARVLDLCTFYTYLPMYVYTSYSYSVYILCIRSTYQDRWANKRFFFLFLFFLDNSEQRTRKCVYSYARCRGTRFLSALKNPFE